MSQPPNHALIPLRRVAAFGIDCGVLGIYAGTLFLFATAKLAPLFHASPFSAELAGFLLLTLPFAVYFAIFESSGWNATPGKRIFRLRVVSVSRTHRITLQQSSVRAALKFLPWELAHFSIWNVFIFDSSMRTAGLVCLIISYSLMAVYALGLFLKPHRTLYDRLAGVEVRLTK